MEGGGARQQKAGALASPSGCGTMFFGSAWLELQEYAAERFAPDGDACGGRGGGGAGEGGKGADGVGRADETKPVLGWDELLSRFMRERGYKLYFPGANLCRQQGDNATQLASESELAALLQRALP